MSKEAWEGVEGTARALGTRGDSERAYSASNEDDVSTSTCWAAQVHFCIIIITSS